MDRREFLAQSALTVAATAATAAAPRAPAGSLQTFAVRVGGEMKAPRIASDFMGLGYEISSVARPGLLSGANEVYIELVRQLGARGVVRVGGNTADYAHYRAHGAPVSTPYGSVVNQAMLADLGAFLQATGWQLIWALNLGSGTEAEAVEEARAVSAATGKHLLAFEIGNEPDIFPNEKHRPPGYDYDAWLADYRRYKIALRAAIPSIAFAGPDVAGKTDWVTRFIADEGKDVVLLTHHYYREGQNTGSTIEKLLGVDPKLQRQLDILRAASESCGVPYRICEVNSFSGGGRPGVSDRMAAALWALDYLFILAASGCAGVNIETGVNQLDFISSYSPIGDDGHGHFVANPEYYGLLAFSTFGQGTLLDVTVEGEPALVKAYATSASEKRLRITLINKGSTDSVLHVSTGNGSQGTAKMIRLTAASVDALTGVMLGGAEISPQGHWKPEHEQALQLRGGRLIVPLPAYSAAFIELGRS